MSVNLARKRKDPEPWRLAGEAARAGLAGRGRLRPHRCRKQADLLARSLREDGRERDAPCSPGSRRPEARDVYIRLSWDGDADFDMLVDEPLGVTAEATTCLARCSAARSSRTGSAPTRRRSTSARGDSTETTRSRSARSTTTPRSRRKPKLEVIAHEGTSQEHKETKTITLPSRGKAPEPVKVTLTGGRRKRALPFLAPAVVVPPTLAGPSREATPRPAADATPKR